jgi:hypothetical protein
MMATTSNAANNERARSNDFDRGFAASSGMAEFPSRLFSGPAFFPEDQRMAIRGASKQASFLERVGPLHTGGHLPRFLQGVHRDCTLAAAVRRDFLLHDVGPLVIVNIAHPDKKMPCAKGATFRRRARKSGVSVSVPCQWYTHAI